VLATASTLAVYLFAGHAYHTPLPFLLLLAWSIPGHVQVWRMNVPFRMLVCSVLFLLYWGYTSGIFHNDDEPLPVRRVLGVFSAPDEVGRFIDYQIHEWQTPREKFSSFAKYL